MEEGGTVYQLYVGIDVAAETFVAAWLAPGGKPVTGEQTPAGFAALQRVGCGNSICALLKPMNRPVFPSNSV